MELTVEEIKTLFAVAGCTLEERVHNDNLYIDNLYITVTTSDDRDIDCECYHKTYDDAYQCIWGTYVNTDK